MASDVQAIIEASQRARHHLLEALIQVNNLFEALKQYRLPNEDKVNDDATNGMPFV